MMMMMMMILSGKGSGLGGGGFWVLPDHTVTWGKSEMISLSLGLACGIWGWTLIFKLISSSNVTDSPTGAAPAVPPPFPPSHSLPPSKLSAHLDQALPCRRLFGSHFSWFQVLHLAPSQEPRFVVEAGQGWGWTW